MLAGVWTLESFDIEKNGIRLPWGEATHGKLVYTRSGYMSVAINCQLSKESQTSTTTADEMKAIYDSVLFYAGTYTMDEDHIYHHVTEASEPKRIGKTMIRRFRLEGDLLFLSNKENASPRAWIRWRKIADV